MGQKTSPIGFRLVRTKDWRSSWYANKQEFGKLLGDDKKIRDFLSSKPSCQGASKFTIRRMSGKVEVTIHTARPGLVIGKKGAEIDQLKADLRKATGEEVWIEVDEIKRPDLDAKLVADAVAKQLERRMPFRRVLKKAMQASMDAGARGIKIQIAGRIGGAEIARTEWYKEGRIPLHTIRVDIDYAMGRAETTYGSIGVKVWINKGEEMETRAEGV
ncbi:MAG: 30S ribosomal protein S3 [Chlamydiae bacterium GWC2_50_10]|uniref:Small ribosomal subunit protein uS3 n=1 Tax=uncultured Chlamydiae bacterium Rifle_16ft_4_minimus_1822 TaxID=1665093 RepID=A0A0H4T1D2_9BACT|nr:30S ribosomal protein S3, small subunit ribosomal protein S3 [uncultured Chlamydiae bacterium Rifle_16ft_4_minimus_1822]OGN52655.1 MAG: 30S ribosomal protein S3 [Chlamydiae bacterium GWA2_50_15]OGN54506.1 MAG: 30S ribosomal protein S3 [Chlamydiae bacterium GWC2_50_10]OGN57900.1 MAG: 30S ribosomal protein S3 [Chlamydiae bacterium RIFCSPHIGHO2_02_FULL_49_29]OGN63523.1 MAG: 30S ribosomal protein S3 [Chlamydiae bacterium RIFCSPHIGHO2_12_FULL_49_32]OGN68370.1 MAG: 30S ribosomal protein S3 [Chlam